MTFYSQQCNVNLSKQSIMKQSKQINSKKSKQCNIIMSNPSNMKVKTKYIRVKTVYYETVKRK